MKNENPSQPCENQCITPNDIQTNAALANAVPEKILPRTKRVKRPWEKSDLESRLKEESIVEAPDGKDADEGLRIPRRWDRFARLVGEAGVAKLMSSHVTVFGLGGVGSYAVESLARSAIGKMTIVDFDDVCVTNVNRQIQAFPSTVGQSKCDLLAHRIAAINPDCAVDPVQAFYDVDNSAALLAPRPDFVIDAIDNVTAKLHLLTTCLNNGIPVVSVTGSGARLDPTQVRVDDISRTRHDPLARVIRKELGRRGFDTSKQVGLPVVFSEEEIIEPIAPSWDEQGFRCICPHAEDSPHACEKRRTIYGTASFVTAAFGMAAASVAVKNMLAEKKT